MHLKKATGASTRNFQVMAHSRDINDIQINIVSSTSNVHFNQSDLESHFQFSRRQRFAKQCNIISSSDGEIDQNRSHREIRRSNTVLNAQPVQVCVTSSSSF